MKQIIQSFKTGQTILEEVPSPVVRKGSVLIRTTRSLVSLGTEKMLVEFGKANLIEKARQQPDKVKQVLDKIKTDGLLPTLESVFNKLGQPLPLGYCNVGRVIGVGEGVTEFHIGDRVASNGNHAEFVCVPENLVAKIPDNVSDEEAAFTVIGSIGLQGIRLCNPSLGETIVVFGLGLIGLITAKLLNANGCKVIGIDLDENKNIVARSFGITAINPLGGDDVVKSVMNITKNVGADGVIITASAKTDSIISEAASMTRKRGRIILVGVIDLNLRRDEFYEKELTFQVSCSYGPGRYDENYEQKGIDYPLPFVRWTEKRNFEAILDSISTGKIEVKSLITEIHDLYDYEKIYTNIGSSKAIASILSYPVESEYKKVVSYLSHSIEKGSGVIGIVGAGNFTQMTLLPALKKIGAYVGYIASSGGVSSTSLAKKYKISKSTTDYKEIIQDPMVDLVMITTRHNLHASMVIDCLQANKNVFVEKPLAITKSELESIIECYANSKASITVGFNRRFSIHSQKVKALIGNSPVNIIATMNAGFIPTNSWIQNLSIGGGRIIGEACHFIDLITFLTSSKVTEVIMNAMGQSPNENSDNACIMLKYENGSLGVINYFSNGSKAYPKERIEVYSQGRTAIIDNFRITKAYGFKVFNKLKTKQDKGHVRQFSELNKSLKNGDNPIIPFDEIINTTKASFAAVESLKIGQWIKI